MVGRRHKNRMERRAVTSHGPPLFLVGASSGVARNSPLLSLNGVARHGDAKLLLPVPRRAIARFMGRALCGVMPFHRDPVPAAFWVVVDFRAGVYPDAKFGYGVCGRPDGHVFGRRRRLMGRLAGRGLMSEHSGSFSRVLQRLFRTIELAHLPLRL